jgi:hypothetical protein
MTSDSNSVLLEWNTRSSYPPDRLHILLLKRIYVLPWSQFVYAEGDEGRVDIFFATHQVTVEGRALDKLLRDIVEKTIFYLVEPGRAFDYQFGVVSHIRSLKVQKLEG